MDRETLIKRLDEYSFYHTIDLGDGVKTPGQPIGPKQKQVLKYISSMSLEGKRVVDLGCANGLFALAAEKQGAEEVIAVDRSRKNIESLESIIVPYLRSNIKAMHLNALDFKSEKYGTFDLVIFAGLLYHMKYPFLALKTIRNLLNDGGVLILETGIIEDFNRNALLYCPCPADSPQKSMGGNACSFFNEKALHETLRYFGISVRSHAYLISPIRRFVKKIYRKSFRSYRISNVVLYCERDCSMDNDFLIQYYEATTN